MTLPSYIGLIGGACSLAGYAPYAISTVKGKAQPQRASWLIWTLSNVLILMASLSLGAYTTMWVLLAYVIGSAVTTVLAFIYGKEGWGNLEKLAFIVAIIASIRWIYFDQPLFALTATLAIGMIGYISNIIHLIKHSTTVAQSELEVWTLFFMGSIFNLFAVAPWTPVLAIVPVSLFIMNGIMFCLTFRNSLRAEKKEAK